MRNTDALEDGGSACSSVEAPAMGVEPRGRHSKTGGHYGQLRNQGGTSALSGKRLPLRKGCPIAMKRRMRRESHVRCCESLEVKFLRATRQIPSSGIGFGRGIDFSRFERQ